MTRAPAHVANARAPLLFALAILDLVAIGFAVSALLEFFQ